MNVNALKSHRFTKLSDGNVQLRGPEGEDLTMETDPRSSSQESEVPISPLCDKLYLIDDAVLPRSLNEAIHEAFRLRTNVEHNHLRGSEHACNRRMDEQ
jgi:hypothetical protein